MAIYVNSIGYSLYTTLSSDSTLVNSGVTVEKDEFMNTDLNLTPWIGVYTGVQQSNPHRMNINEPWMNTVDFHLIIQESNFDGSGESTQDRLDKLWSAVYTAINSNRTLDDTVLHIVNITNEPFQRNREDDEAFFSNEVIITAEVEG